MFEEIAFVRLIPTDLVCRHRADVQAIDIRGGNQSLNQFRISSDCRDDQAWSKRFRNLVLVDFHDAGKRKQKFLVGERMIRVFTEHDGRKQVRTIVPAHQSFALAVSAR